MDPKARVAGAEGRDDVGRRRGVLQAAESREAPRSGFRV